MRPRELCFLFALLLVQPAPAQERKASPGTGAVTFRDKIFRDVLLRDGGKLPPPALYPLPPGGRELDLQPTTSTPYDRYFPNVQAVMANLTPQKTSLARVGRLMKIGHSFDYQTSDPYRPEPPKQTETQHAGDCKSKALWLFENIGDPGALFVIGKIEKNSRTSHAWVYWRNEGQWLILDCTDRMDPIVASTVSADRYIPYYSYGKQGVYRHKTTSVGLPVVSTTVAAMPSREN